MATTQAVLTTAETRAAMADTKINPTSSERGAEVALTLVFDGVEINPGAIYAALGALGAISADLVPARRSYNLHVDHPGTFFDPAETAAMMGDTALNPVERERRGEVHITLVYADAEFDGAALYDALAALGDVQADFFPARDNYSFIITEAPTPPPEPED